MKNKFLKKLLIVIAISAFIFQLFGPISGAASLNLQVIVDKQTGKTNEVFTFTIKYANPDTMENLHAASATIVATLPANLSYVGADASEDYPHVDVSGNIITFSTDGADLIAGKTGFVKVRAQFVSGVTHNGDTAHISANATNSPEITAIVDASQLSVVKTKNLPIVNPALDSNVTYNIHVSALSTGLKFNDVVVVDTLPPNTTFVSASNGGTNVAGVITWNIGSMDAGAAIDLTVVVKYMDANFNVGDTPDNIVEVTGTDFDGNIRLANHNLVVTLAAPILSMNALTKASRQGADRYAIGQDMTFSLGGIGNGGNVPLDNMTLIDTIPNEMDLKSVTTGNYSYATGVTIDVSYQTHDGGVLWTAWATGVLANANQTLNVPALGIGDYITNIRWSFSQVPVSFGISTPIRVVGTLLATAHGGAAITPDVSTVTNNAELKATGVADSLASAVISVYSPSPYLVLSKTVDKASVFELETVTYTIRVTNHQYATGDLSLGALDSLVLTDVLPAFLSNATFAPGILTGTATTLGQMALDASTGTKEWTLTDTVLKPGEYVEVTFSAAVVKPTPVGNYGNTVTLAPVNVTLDDRSVDSATANAFIKFTGSLASEKLVKGDLDVNFTKYPNSATLAGGPAKYQLTISNTNSNGPISNIIIIDKLPRAGDIGVIDTSLRGSTWKPNLVNDGVTPNVTGLNGAALAAGVTVYYSTIVSPDLGALSDPLHKNNYNTGWSTTPPADITSVTALKFDFGAIQLTSGQTVVLEWDMRSPVVTPVDEIAWNSFGYVATYTDVSGEEPFLPSEPIKVGIKVAASPALNSGIGDYIWEDINKNGIQDAGEPGLNSIVVKLYEDANNDGSPDGAAIDYTMTANDYTGRPGYYAFPLLGAGKYIVEFLMPANYFITNVNSGGDDGKDSDFTQFAGTAHRTATIDLPADTQEMNIDAGIFQKAIIGDFVWKDQDKDGIKDGGEPAIAGVTVELYNTLDNLLASAVTDGSGLYSFSVDPGSYYLKVINPGDDYAFSPKDVGGDTLDSDFDPTNFVTTTITVTSGLSDLKWDCGLYLGKVGSYVWDDYDADGVLDGGEPGINNVTVKLTDGITTWTTTTNAGSYEFTDVVPGDYTVEFTKPAGFDVFTDADAGGNDTTDSDAIYTLPGDGIASTATFAQTAGEWDMTRDAGFYKFASIGNKVFKDMDQDGQQDAVVDVGIEGIRVDLYRTTDLATSIANILTAADGTYSFTGLKPGNYTLKFATPVGYYPTSIDTGNDSTDSDANIVTGYTGSYNLISGENETSVDAGFHKARLGNFVWEDSDYDGNQDDGATGINGVTVKLYTTGDLVTPILTTTTASKDGVNGCYAFEDLDGGDYVIEFLTPNNYYTTRSNAVGDTVDSDIDANIAPNTLTRTATITLANGVNDTSNDAGLYRLASIGDLVWEDKNYDGTRQAGEIPSTIAGATVTLVDVNNILDGGYVKTTTTNATGNYTFSGLRPGTYQIQYSVPAGFDGYTVRVGVLSVTTNSDPVQATGLVAAFNIASNQNYTYVDVGVFKYAQLSNFVFLDTNVNGIQDGGELGVADVTVRLLNSVGGLLQTTTTDADGLYSFINLVPGVYKVQVMNPTDLLFTKQDLGGNDALDSDISESTGITNNITLSSGDNNTSVDAGLYHDNYLGDTIWNDYNQDGIQDIGEPGLFNITVRLYNQANVLKGTTTTDVDGQYQFSHLPADLYYIMVTPAATWYLSPTDSGGDDTLDSDLVQGTNKSQLINLLHLVSITDVDCGLFQKASIGDYVWEDLNGNGVQDLGETPISGVTVTLTDSLSATTVTTTDASGAYTFGDLKPGTYSVDFTTPAGFTITLSNQGGDDTKDNDMDGSGHVAGIVLTPGQTRTDIDAGYYKVASIGNKVFNDLNQDGQQAGGTEVGISGVRVDLYKTSDTTSSIANTNTAADGTYTFTGLKPDDYTLKFTTPAGYAPSLVDVGNDTSDSDASIATGYTISYTLSSGENEITVDAGYHKGRLGNFVWEDMNYDGLQNDGATGINGVTVNIYSTSDLVTPAFTTISATIGGITGSYLFEDLNAGDYVLEFVTPATYYPTVINAGNDALDSDMAVNAPNRTVPITVAVGGNDLSYDAGYYRHASIGNFLWEDLNYNHVQDGGESGISGATVSLTDINDVVLGTTTTNGSGVYNFSTPPGTYKLHFTLPATYTGFVNKGAGTATDSDADVVTGIVPSFTVISNQTITDIDAGVYKYATLSDRVFIDANVNGIQDGGEVGFENVTVNLLDAGNTVLATTTTDVNGLYIFDNLLPGIYKIKVMNPADFLFTLQDIGGDDTLDSDISTTTGVTGNITLVSSQDNTSVDAGLYHDNSIGDTIWNDLNANGIQDAGEAGIQNVSIALYNHVDLLIGLTTTDANGQYLFSDLPIGQYYIKATIPADWFLTPTNSGGDDTKDSDLAQANNQSQLVSLGHLQNITHLDGGMYQKATLGDFVWHDVNGNGLQDGGETPINGVTVTLTDALSVTTQTTTDVNGAYQFASLIPGTYNLDFTTPLGYVRAKSNQGANDALDNDMDGTGHVAGVTLQSAQTRTDVDAGFNQLGSIGDFIWVDTNANGIQDAGELGLKDIKLTLIDENLQTTVTQTDATGHYLFDHLEPGVYAIKLEIQGNYIITNMNRGADDTKDSDFNIGTNTTGPIALTSQGSITDVDGGLVPFIPTAIGEIGDFVWLDSNMNGIQDAGEMGLSNIKLVLYDKDNKEVAVTYTDYSGKYIFPHLLSGKYKIVVNVPTEYAVTTSGTTSEDKDSDAELSGIIALFDFYGINNYQYDVGLYLKGTCGNKIWLDENRNGLQDSSEKGIPSITVKLLSSTGFVISTGTTDSAGMYLFEKLPLTDYKIQVVIPEGYKVTDKNIGSTDIDSNIDLNGFSAVFNLGAVSRFDLTIDGGLYIPVVDPEKKPDQIPTVIPDKVIIKDEEGKIISVVTVDPSITLLVDFEDILDDMVPTGQNYKITETTDEFGNKVTIIQYIGKENESVLPNTGTNHYTLLILGIALFLASLVALLLQRIKDKTE